MKPLIFSFLILAVAGAGTTPQAEMEDLVARIVQQAIENDRNSDDYGFYEKAVTRELDSNGKLKKEETRTYQTVWIEGKPYSELVKVNDRPPDGSRKKEETKRRQEFIKALHGKKKAEDTDSIEVKWEDLSRKYDFTLLPSDGVSFYLLRFQPRKGKLPERNKVEKVFNNLEGEIRADENYNLIGVKTNLVRSVKFGLGIFAKIDTIDISYSQKSFEQVCLPESFTMKFKARIALFKTENQEVNITFSDYFHRPAS